jgi:CheY-like chemotaxis protein
MMPVMSGWEFRERQRRDAALAGIPVVVLTGTADSASASSLAAAAYLCKPVDSGELLDAVLRHASAEEQGPASSRADPRPPCR